MRRLDLALKEVTISHLNEVQKTTVATAPKVKNPIDIKTFLPYRMFRLAMRMSRTGNKLSTILKESTLPIGEREWRVVAIVGAYGGITNRDISQVTGMDAATISRAVQALKKFDLVETRRSKRDRRKVLIVLTDSGVDFHDTISPMRIETGKIIESCLNDDERNTLFKLLNQLDQHLDTLETDDEEEWI